MDARMARAAVLAVALVSLGASYRTPNFVVTAPSPQIAEQIGKQAEAYRRDLSVLWLGSALPNWTQPCPISAQVAENLGAGGATSFMFDHGEVFGWTMQIQGSLERILDSVLPHEVTHTVFASHFRRPLPRWADEGACTTVEHASERGKQQQMLITFLRTNRGIPFHTMFALKEYPADVLPLYAQGHSLASFLIQQGGRQKYLNFIAAGLQSEQWPSAVHQHYGYADLAQLQNTWLDWVRKGSPTIKKPEPGPAPAGDALLVSNNPRKKPEPNLIYRGQSNDDDPRTPTPGPQAPAAAPQPSRDNAAANLAGNLVPITRPKRGNQPRPDANAFAANVPLPGPGALNDMQNPTALPGPGFDAPANFNQPNAGGRGYPSATPSSPAPDRRVILEWDAGNPGGAANAPGAVPPSRMPPPPAGRTAPGTRPSVYMSGNSPPVAAD